MEKQYLKTSLDGVSSTTSTVAFKNCIYVFQHTFDFEALKEGYKVYCLILDCF